MKCPYCYKELELGVIYAGRTGMKWYAENRELKKRFKLAKGKRFFGLITSTIDAYRCLNCEKLFIFNENLKDIEQYIL